MKMRRLVCLLLALGLCAAAPSALGSYPDGGFRPEASPGETLRAARISCTEEVLYESMAFPVTLEILVETSESPFHWGILEVRGVRLVFPEAEAAPLAFSGSVSVWQRGSQTLEVAINGDVFYRGAAEAAEAEVKSEFFFPLEGGVSAVYPSLERPASSRAGYLDFHRFVRPVLAPVPAS